ncbi:hypothetical protein C8F01DRAFT_141782 [Mycena amicta]|nr:hypothetical protein C8F01DRAFT_141782 [Mycena amicta]
MQVILDDRDSSVNYSSGWTFAGLGEFDATTSNPKRQGATAQMSFNGTSITVFGTVQSGNGSSTLAFSVDDGPAIQFSAVNKKTSATRHQLLFAYASLAREHILNITYTNAGVNQISLDYFIYNTTSTTGRQTVFVDDVNPVVHYSPTGWTKNSSAEYFQGGTHLTEIPGSWVMVTFQGDLLTLHGAYSSQSKAFNSSTFAVTAVIDGGSSVQLPSRPSSSTDAAFTLNNVLFNSSILTQGTHTINFTFMGGDPLFIDYFLIQNISDILVSEPNPTPVSQPMNRHTVVVAAAAGTAAGVVLLALLVLAIWDLKRKRTRNSLQTLISLNASEPIIMITPFPLDPEEVDEKIKGDPTLKAHILIPPLPSPRNSDPQSPRPAAAAVSNRIVSLVLSARSLDSGGSAAPPSYHTN